MKKTIIQQINDMMKNASMIEAYRMMIFYSDNAGSSRNKKKQKQNEGYTKRIQKLGEKKWGFEWWKR